MIASHLSQRSFNLSVSDKEDPLFSAVKALSKTPLGFFCCENVGSEQSICTFIRRAAWRSFSIAKKKSRKASISLIYNVMAIRCISLSNTKINVSVHDDVADPSTIFMRLQKHHKKKNALRVVPLIVQAF